MIRTISTEVYGDVNLYFGYRCLDTIQKVLGITDLVELGNKFHKVADSKKGLNLMDISNFTAKMLWIGHENYCFMQRKDLVVDSWERMIFVIDEIKLKTAIPLATTGIKDILDIEGDGTKKK
jgi:hypothetical protein